ncbi:type II toxin-antitoxin system RelE/ParE family toxin [Conexibacter sp. S30A1]|uniref:type II toxin-antitoxin system RelE/ParE family toxin n=1 Tax=Conexibacter sp. S30A1 TaxID=2937800 RepID=UPI00200E6646|nr:type II toxin-antitoxin system RelE/ParE family toxin [Conexibacter sp. S30A1]
MAWEIELTDQARDWIESLDDDDYDSMAGVLDLLEQLGPSLGRPAADVINGSRHHNMKELRSSGRHLRALFCFDPRRTAIVLLGGDKASDWTGWYERSIPIADELYDEYLAELETEGLI